MGLLERFQEKIEQRKTAFVTERKQKKAALDIIKQKEKAAYYQALEKERVTLAQQKAKRAAVPFGSRLLAAGKELRGYQRQVAKRRKTKDGFSFEGPSVATPDNNSLFEVRDFRK